MSNRLCTRILGLFLSVSLGYASLVHGEGFRVLGQGTSGHAQGDAFSAQADDPSALYYNPAGMTQLEGTQLSAGVLLVGGYHDFENTSGETFKGDLKDTIAIPPPSAIYLTYNMENLGKTLDVKLLERLSVGIGLNSPYGLLINWPKDITFSSVTTFAQLPLVDIKPTIAYKFNDYLSVGGGLDIYTFIGFLGGGDLTAKSFDQATGTNFELNGKGTAVGFNVGFLLTPWRTSIGGVRKPRLNLAFVYRSKATLNLTGDFRVAGKEVARADFDLKLPQIFTWGAAVWPIRNDTHEWKLELDLDYADWSSFDNLDITLSNGVTIPEPRNWKGAVVIKFGTEFKWLRIPSFRGWEVAVRAGYIRSNSPEPEETFEPRIPDYSFNGLSFGFGFMCKEGAHLLGLMPCKNSLTEAIALEFAYKNQLFEGRTIGKANPNPLVRGKYDSELHAAALGIRVNF